MKVTLTVGLPASGKTSWAMSQVTKSNGQTKRLNKDDLRSMLDGGFYSKSNEKSIIKLRDCMLIELLKNKHNVIIDDTNLNKNNLYEIEKLINDNFPDSNISVVENISFLKVPIDECIKRDSVRLNSVGRDVIEKMYRENGNRFEFLKWKYNNKDGYPAIICDIDGTLANNLNRSPYDLTKCGEDEVFKHIKDLLAIERSNGTQIILVSGRSESFRVPTIKWCNKHNIETDFVFMRKADDDRKDDIVKYDLFMEHINPMGLYIKYVLDDRNRVVDMWRNRCYLNCLQVNYGDF